MSDTTVDALLRIRAEDQASDVTNRMFRDLNQNLTMISQRWTQNINAPAQQTINVFQQVGQAAQQHIGGTAGVAGAFERAAGQAAAYFKNMAGLGSIALMIETGRRAMEYSADVERGFNRIMNATGASREEIGKLNKDLTELARTGVGSLTELQGEYQHFAEMTNLRGQEAREAFKQIVEAADAAGVAVSSMSAGAATAIATLKVPTDDLGKVLANWATTMPRQMLETFAAVVPRIASTLDSVGVSGTKAALQMGQAFTIAEKSFGNARLAASTLDSLIEKATDIHSVIGGLTLQALDQNKLMGKTSEDLLVTIEKQFNTLGLLNKDIMPSTLSLMLSTYGISRQQYELVVKDFEYRQRAREEAARTHESEEAVLNRYLARLKDQKAHLDEIWARVKEIGGTLGQILSSFGIPQSVVTDLEAINKALTSIDMLIRKLKGEKINWSDIFPDFHVPTMGQVVSGMLHPGGAPPPSVPLPRPRPRRAPGRQAGGPVAGGSPYVVGEAGPEVFVPEQSGGVAAGGFDKIASREGVRTEEDNTRETRSNTEELKKLNDFFVFWRDQQERAAAAGGGGGGGGGGYGSGGATGRDLGGPMGKVGDTGAGPPPAVPPAQGPAAGTRIPTSPAEAPTTLKQAVEGGFIKPPPVAKRVPTSPAEAPESLEKAYQGGFLPRPFQEGGVVDRPTVALLGEQGPEAVVPLSGTRTAGRYETEFRKGDPNYLGSARARAAGIASGVGANLVRAPTAAGTITANASAAADMQAAVNALAAAGAPLSSVVGNYNRRFIANTSTWSPHAYGGAIDLGQSGGGPKVNIGKMKINKDFYDWVQAHPDQYAAILREHNMISGQHFHDLGHIEWGGPGYGKIVEARLAAAGIPATQVAGGAAAPGTVLDTLRQHEGGTAPQSPPTPQTAGGGGSVLDVLRAAEAGPTAAGATGNANLQQLRAPFADELKNPETRRRLLAAADAEDDRSPQGRVAFMESVLNAAKSEGKSVGKILDDRHFFPPRTQRIIANRRFSEAEYRTRSAEADTVLGGSDISGGATGNYSPVHKGRYNWPRRNVGERAEGLGDGRVTYVSPSGELYGVDKGRGEQAQTWHDTQYRTAVAGTGTTQTAQAGDGTPTRVASADGEGSVLSTLKAHEAHTARQHAQRQQHAAHTTRTAHRGRHPHHVRGRPPRAMQEGGVVTEPTMAMIGEGGPEAVVPLGGAGRTGAGTEFPEGMDPRKGGTSAFWGDIGFATNFLPGGPLARLTGRLGSAVGGRALGELGGRVAGRVGTKVGEEIAGRGGAKLGEEIEGTLAMSAAEHTWHRNQQVNQMIKDAQAGRKAAEGIIQKPYDTNIILKKPTLNQVSHIGRADVRRAHYDAVRADRLAQVGNSFMG